MLRTISLGWPDLIGKCPSGIFLGFSGRSGRMEAPKEIMSKSGIFRFIIQHVFGKMTSDTSESARCNQDLRQRTHYTGEM